MSESAAETEKRDQFERRQFDFWIGEWDCRWDGGEGSNTIVAELDGMVILERFDGRPGTPLLGLSLSVYDDAAAVWRQAWADSSGTYLDFVGTFADGVMDLRREATSADGAPLTQRMRFTEIAAERLVWLWERRRAGSTEWDVLWRIDYTRRA
ncbi:MAG TPA: hypothetical protein VGM80_09450 [Gaiellaceae bacterium]